MHILNVTFPKEEHLKQCQNEEREALFHLVRFSNIVGGGGGGAGCCAVAPTRLGIVGGVNIEGNKEEERRKKQLVIVASLLRRQMEMEEAAGPYIVLQCCVAYTYSS